MQRPEQRELALAHGLPHGRLVVVRVEDQQDGDQDEEALEDAEEAAEDLVEHRVALEQRGRPVRDLDTDAQRDGRRDEHGTERDHEAVGVGDRGPFVGEVCPQRCSQVRPEHDGEQDGRDSEQPADDALRVADHEHRQEREKDHEIERLDAHARLLPG